MTLPEASRCFPVSVEEFQIYEKNGILNRYKKRADSDFKKTSL